MNPTLGIFLFLAMIFGAIILCLYIFRKYSQRDFNIKRKRWNRISQSLKCSRCGRPFEKYQGRVWADQGAGYISGPIIECRHCLVAFHYWMGKKGPEVLNEESLK